MLRIRYDSTPSVSLELLFYIVYDEYILMISHVFSLCLVSLPTLLIRCCVFLL